MVAFSPFRCSVARLLAVPLIHALIIVVFPLPIGHGQTISTNMALPAMQWLRVNASGSAPPGLSHACLMGPTLSATSSVAGANNAYLFGGLSGSNSPTSETYTLSYGSGTATWSQPTTSSTLFTSQPAARSHAVCGWDASSNYRNELVLYGGRGASSAPLGDIWAFDATNNFWAQNSTPTASAVLVYGAVGGIDPTYTPSTPATQNGLLFAAGVGSGGLMPMTSGGPTGITIGGQLSSNQDTLTANVAALASVSGGDSLSPRWGAAGTILQGSQVVVFSGCNTTASAEFASSSTVPNATCALPSGGVLGFGSSFSPSSLSGAAGTWSEYTYCPAPRVGGTMVPNRQTSDSTFTSHAILIGGAIDRSTWDDQGGSAAGEVAVLNAGSGVWARVLPQGDNGQVPSAREGASALALATTVSGITGAGPTTGAVDILVYGGREVATGTMLSDLWVLRLYPDQLTGNGTAKGVTNTYMPSCVGKVITRNGATTTMTSASGAPTATSTLQPNPSGATWTASASHKVLSSIAVGAMMPAILLLRATTFGSAVNAAASASARFGLLGWPLLAACYGFAITGLVLGFSTSEYRTGSMLRKRSLTSPSRALSTTHARAGLAFVILGCGVVPLLYLVAYLRSRPRSTRLFDRTPQCQPRSTRAVPTAQSRDALGTPNSLDPMLAAQSSSPGRPVEELRPRIDSTSTQASITAAAHAAGEPSESPRALASPRPSLGDRKSVSDPLPQKSRIFSSLRSRSGGNEGPHSRPSSYPESPSRRSFEVVNRRRMFGRDHLPSTTAAHGRRRSLTLASETDDEEHPTSSALIGAQTMPGSPARSVSSSESGESYRPSRSGLRRIADFMLHATLLGANVFLVVTMFLLGHAWGAAAYLVICITFYAAIVALAWYGHPSPESSLVIFVSRLRGQTPPPTEVVYEKPRPSSDPPELASPMARPMSLTSTMYPPGTFIEPWSEAGSVEGSRRALSGAEMEEVDPSDQYLEEREVQIVTAPRRRLTVVNE